MKISESVWQFIADNEGSDLTKLLLKKQLFPEVSNAFLVQQIQGRTVAKRKFPFLLDVPKYLFPTKVSLEQATGQAVGQWKSSLFSGSTMADLTGGMGLDTYFVGKSFQHVAYVEPNEQLCELAKNNLELLGINHTVFHTDAETFLQEASKTIDLLYIDPSRRVDTGRKISIENYQPNITELLPDLFRIGKKVAIKLSPLQDIAELHQKLPHIQHIYVVAEGNEVKELLVVLNQNYGRSPILEVIDVLAPNPLFTTNYPPKTVVVECSDIKQYLFQPHKGLLKAGLQDHVAAKHQLSKLAPFTHLYTSDSLVENYEGKIFEVLAANVPGKKLSEYFPEKKANIVAKNYPLSPAQLANKYNLKEGGDLFLFGYSDHTNKKRLAICRRL